MRTVRGSFHRSRLECAFTTAARWARPLREVDAPVLRKRVLVARCRGSWTPIQWSLESAMRRIMVWGQAVADAVKQRLSAWALQSGFRLFGTQSLHGFSISYWCSEELAVEAAPKIASALQLIQQTDPRALLNVRDAFSLLIVGLFDQPGTVRPASALRLPTAYVKRNSVDWLASVLVYHATASLCESSGNSMSASEAGRQAQLAFVRQLPGREDLIAHLEDSATFS